MKFLHIFLNELSINFLKDFKLFLSKVNPAAILWPPPLIINLLSKAFLITKPISKPEIDLAEPFNKFCELVITIAGLLKISFNLAAIIPIRPSLMLG